MNNPSQLPKAQLEARMEVNLPSGTAGWPVLDASCTVSHIACGLLWPASFSRVDMVRCIHLTIPIGCFFLCAAAPEPY